MKTTHKFLRDFDSGNLRSVTQLPEAPAYLKVGRFPHNSAFFEFESLVDNEDTQFQTLSKSYFNFLLTRSTLGEICC